MLKENISRKDTSVAAGQYIKEKKFWLDNLSGNLVKSTFPYDYYKKKSVPNTPGENERRFETEESRVSGELFSKLMRLSNNSNLRLHIVLVAGIVVLLEKYTGNNDIIVGVPIYKQRIEGKFVNTALALRNKPEENITFKELLLQLRQTIGKANENLNYPVETLLYQLNIPFSRDDDFPLFDIGILLENVHHRHYFQDINLNMIFNFLRTDECINVHIEYNSLLYKETTIQRIMAHLKNFLAGVLPDGLNLSIEEIDILSEQERKQVLVDFNHTAEEYPKDKTTQRLFEEQVEKTPHHAAVVGTSVTSTGVVLKPVPKKDIHYTSYKKLNENASRLAAQLRRAGVKPGKIVAIMMERTVEMLIGIFGVLKAGGAYLPISTDTPRHRILVMLQDCQVSIILTMSGIVDTNFARLLQDFRSNEIIPFKTGIRPQIKDFDNLPFPDRSLVNYEKYNEYIGQALVKNSISLQTSRGCPYLCSYCHKIWPKRCVNRSAENIFAEVKQYYDIGVRRFVFIDDIFNFDRKNSSRFFELVIENGLDVQFFFPNGLRGDLLTEEYIDLMVKAGTVELALALETASPRLQKLIKKNLDLEKLRENIEYFTGKYPHVILELFTMHGFPTETEEEAMKTLDFIKSIKWLHFPYVSILKIYPGTDMEKLALDSGISREAIVGSDHLAAHELPDTLPFDNSFTLRYQSDFLNNYFLSRERLLHVLPHQMKLLTEDEMVQKYNSFLPTDISNFEDLLDFVGIKREELNAGADGFVDEAKNIVPNLNLKMRKYFPLKESSEKALKVLLLDLSQFFTADAHKLYDVVEPPLGAMYLVTYLNHRLGNKVNGKIAKSRVDFDNYSQLNTLLEEFKPDVIGIRTLSFFKEFFHKTVALIRQWGIEVPIISGGPYATGSYRTILQDRNIDLVVLGEGEVTFSEVIEKMIENGGKLPNQKELENIAGIAFIPGKAGLEQRGQPRVIMLDTLNEVLSGESPANLTPVNHSEDLAYVIFTSGSTGKPKGTMMEHKSVNNLVYGLKSKIYKHYSGHLKVSLVAPFEFDASVQQIFGALLQGHALYIVPEDTRIDGAGLLEFYRKYNINISDGTPTHIRLLLENIEGKIVLPFIKHFIIAGEVLPQEIAAGFLQCFQENIPGISNLYGPTETCVDSTFYHISPATLEMLNTIPIGKPLPNQQVYIIGKENQLQPIGVVGELTIGGDGVARGYLNRPELTAEKFCLRRPGGRRMAHGALRFAHLPRKNFLLNSFQYPITPLPHSPIYMTGDLARWLADGDIEFLGRIDHQLKIRGFRIELGEIESQLRAHESIKDSVVVPIEDEQGDRSLCAYYVEKTGEGIECWPSVGEYFVWDDLLYYAMTNDKPRNRSYKVAIDKLVRDKTVVEIGTGPDAILARLCAQAGVKKVYAIEILEESYKKARETVRQLNLEEKITVIHGDATTVQLPEKVDVCLSQIIGNIASSEGAIHILNNARRFLKKDGIMIPAKCQTKIAAVQLPEEIHENPGFSEISKIYPDKIFKALGYKFDFRVCVKNFPQSAVISNVETFENLDFSGIITLENTQKVNFTIRGNARIDGFLLWINLYTMEDEVIDTSENKYVWSPVFIPVFYPGVDVSTGDMIRAECIRNVSNNNICPDYKIKGVFIFNDGENLEFEYDFPYLVRAYRKNPFYQTLFKDGSINVLKNRQAGMSVSELKEYLQRELPDHMIPTYFVQLEEVPLAHNGKVDRKALPRPEPVVEGEYAAARHELDKKLIEIWSEVLGIEKDIIGIDGDFFRMGGHSLKATRLVTKIHKALNVKLPLVEVFAKATVRKLSDYLAGVARDRYVSIHAVEAKEYHAVSSAQKRLYVLHQLDRANINYNMPTMVSLGRDIEKDKFEAIFRRLIRRHEIFRTSFEIIEGKPVQRVRGVVEFAIDYHGPRQGLHPREIIDGFIKPFDLSHPPLMRVGLIDTKEENILMLDMHHIVSDGTASGIFVKEFTALYRGEALPPLRVQYKDYAEWQNSEEQTQKLKKQEEYWQKRFEVEPPILTLPTDYARPTVQDFEGRSSGFALEPGKTDRLNALALKEETTLFMLLLAIFNVLLAKISGQDDIVVGTGIEGRRHEDLHYVIGMFVNTLALRNHPQPGISFLQFLAQVKKTTLEAFENQDYQFENLVERVVKNRDVSRNPLFDIHFQLQNIETPMETRGLKLKSYDFEHKITKMDLMLSGLEVGNNLRFGIQYCTKLFKNETIERFVVYFKRVIGAILEEPGKKIYRLELISGEEKQQLLYDDNRTETGYPGTKTVHELFAARAAANPDKIAVVHAGQGPGTQSDAALTYKKLNERAAQLSCILEKKGGGPGQIVGVVAERSIEMIVGLLGILKAGSVYLPIDTGLPGARLSDILQDSQAKTLLTQGNRFSLPAELEFRGETVDLLEEGFYTGDRENKGNMKKKAGPGSPAYVIYTSGTTGIPKGVLVAHRNIIRLTVKPNYIELTGRDKLLMTGVLSFDISTFEIWGPLLNGVTLYLADEDTVLNGEGLGAALARHKISILHLIPQLFNRYTMQCIEIFSGLKYLLVGGDIVRSKYINQVRNRHSRLKILQMYGPTENTTFSTYHLVDRNYEGSIPIGKPISNSTAYIVDKYQQLLPLGLAGELWVGGDGLACGYLNQPELTAEKFIELEVKVEVEEHMSHMPYISYIYKTGDLARRLPGGNIEFLGRIDRQVKIRGVRIELAEIESQLLKHKEIKEVVLLAEEDESREKNLYAYIVTNHRLAVAQLREYLSRTLPDYMIPSYFRQLEQIPLTGNGKVDRKALPGLGAEVAEVNYRPPRDHLEEKLAAIWSDVLKIPKNKIGIDHNFFHLGGHSLKATTLVSKIHKELEVNVPLVRVFETRSIRKLSGYIRGAAPDKFTPIEPVEKKEYYPLSSAQQRLYMLQQLQLESIGYNMPFCYVLEKEPETGELKEIFRKLIHRHESLRTSFEIVANVPVQRIHTEVPFDIERLDSTAGSLPGAADPREGVDSIIEDFIRPFDLSQAPLLRVGLTVLPGESLANRCLLLVDIHHISADGKSHLILLNDYQSFGRGNQLPGLRLQYKDYARWQNRQNEKETIKKQEAFWLNEFSGEIPVLDLPGDYTRPLIQSFEGNHVDFRVGKEMAAVFKKLLLQEGATLFMGVLAVFNIFLFKVSNQEDIVIGSPVAARRHADLEQVIGMFVNTLALRNFPTAAKTFMEFLREIKTRSLQALENQEFPFEDLVDRLNVKRDVGRNPLFDVMLTFGNIDGPGIAEGMNRTGTASGLKTYELDAHIVKFDMMLFAAESGEELLFPLAYCSKLFKPGTADRFKRVFNTIFTAIIADPGQRISGIEIIAEDERKLILHDFNRTTARYPRHKTVDELFVEQVYKNPAKIAVSCENHSITYNELDNRSGTLAALLRSKGVHHEAVVGVMMENTAERITGLIAVLKAGGAYLPIDRQYPGKRKKYMMKDGNVGILLSDDKVPVSSEIQIINPGDSMIYANKKENPRGKDHRFNSLAYIIYTSGSTGIPKGVMVQHRCVVRLVKNTNFITFDNNERILQTGALEFDASTFEIWGSLLNGLVLHLAAKEKILDANVFKDIIARCKISTIWLTSSLFNQFVEVGIDIFSGLKNLLVGGEALSPLHINRIKTKFPGLKVINGYGPTENTTFSTTYTINKKYNQRIPIGKPINNSSAFILSGYDNFQPIGVSGELCVGGDGVARGYLNDVSLTARRFTMSPDVAGERIYRTGDQARWKPDGNIDFLGRFDFQVKIRGFRVEPEEIENQLLTHEKIKEAAVLVRETDGKHLYAYIVPLVSQPDSAGEFDISELKAHLSKQLPAYMIPDYFILLEKMPLTKNGKLDRKILSEMGTKLAANVEYVAPKTNLQKIIAESWKQVLTLPKVGMNDNFFDIGGNSFNIITLSFHLKKLLRKEISIAKIFQYPTIALFAEYLDTEKDDNMENISKKEDHSQVQLENVKNRIKQKRKRRR